MRKRLVVPSYYTKKFQLFDFSKGVNGSATESLLSPSIAKKSFNFCLNNGGLTDGVGVEQFSIKIGENLISPTLPNGVIPLKLFFYKRYDYVNENADDRLLAYCDNGKVYQCFLYKNQGEMEEIIGLEFSGEPNGVCYKYNGDDVIILSFSDQFKLFDGESVLVVEGVPEITSMCVHGERLFVTTGGEQTSLWFSDDFNPTDWFVSLSQAGFIDFQDGRGRLLKAISFNDYVYLFRSYGISRVYAYGEQANFSTAGLFLGSGRIFDKAIISCGDKIIYLAEDGFYAFDGYNSVRILSGLDKFLKGVDNSDAQGKFYNGNLFVNLNVKISGKTEKTLLVYNLVSGSYYLAKGLNLHSIEPCLGNSFSRMLALCEGGEKIGQLNSTSKVFGRSLKKVWQSNFSDFSIPQFKNLVKASVYTTKKAKFKFISEIDQREIELKGSPNLQVFTIGLKGKNFMVEISSKEPNLEISKLTLNFSYFK